MPNVIFCDSADHYATADIAKKWTPVNAPTVSAGNGRNGTSSLRLPQTGVHSVTTAFASMGAVYVEFAFRVTWIATGEITLINLLDAGTTQLDLRLSSSSGGMRITRNGTQLAASTAPGLTSNTWYHLGFGAVISDTGSYEVRLNGVQVAALTGSGDTKNTGSATASQVRLSNVTNHNLDIDDVVISSDGFCGDCRVQALFPQGAGNYSQWTPSAGLGWQCVDETAMNSDTDYVSSGAAAQRNSYDFQSAGAGVVKAVQHVTTVRKDDAGSRTIKQFARISGTDYDDAAVSVSDTYVMQRRVMAANPATGTDWTVSQVDASEFGCKLES